jgi:hypothetical protein
MRRVRLAVLVLSVAGVVAACSGAAAPAVVQAPDLTLPAADMVPASRTIPNTEVTLDPPGVANIDSARVSSAAAYKLCGSGVAHCGRGAPAKIELARVTDPSWGDANSSAGGLHGLLVWAFTWSGPDACAPVFGGYTASSSAPTPPESAECQMVTFVDATTGSYIYSLQN